MVYAIGVSLETAVIVAVGMGLPKAQEIEIGVLTESVGALLVNSSEIVTG
jgi:hypothetical protein